MGGNGSDHGVRLGYQLIKKIEYLTQKNEAIFWNLASGLKIWLDKVARCNGSGYK